MGYSRWSDAAYTSISAARSTRSSREIFRGTSNIDPLMDPLGMTHRESRDSEHHPHSVPIIVAFDVTGSMGDIPTRFAQEMLGKLMKMLVERNYVTDPQLLFAAVGDAVSDQAPLQVGQFESGLEMDMWLTRLWLEGGGGDAPESYLLPCWFAAYHTATDAWEKRREKGYLFTIGDATNKPLDAKQIERVFGYAPARSTANADVISAAAERWSLHHILITRGSRPRAGLLKHWRRLLDKRLLVLDETEAICDLIGVCIGLQEGRLDQAAGRTALASAGMKHSAIDPILAALR